MSSDSNSDHDHLDQSNLVSDSRSATSMPTSPSPSVRVRVAQLENIDFQSFLETIASSPQINPENAEDLRQAIEERRKDIESGLELARMAYDLARLRANPESDQQASGRKNKLEPDKIRLKQEYEIREMEIQLERVKLAENKDEELQRQHENRKEKREHEERESKRQLDEKERARQDAERESEREHERYLKDEELKIWMIKLGLQTRAVGVCVLGGLAYCFLGVEAVAALACGVVPAALLTYSHQIPPEVVQQIKDYVSTRISQLASTVGMQSSGFACNMWPSSST